MSRAMRLGKPSSSPSEPFDQLSDNHHMRAIEELAHDSQVRPESEETTPVEVSPASMADLGSPVIPRIAGHQTTSRTGGPDGTSYRHLIQALGGSR